MEQSYQDAKRIIEQEYGADARKQLLSLQADHVPA
jgi:hypothetical protein